MNKIFCYFCNTETNYEQWSKFNQYHLKKIHKDLNFNKEEYCNKFKITITEKVNKVICKLCNEEFDISVFVYHLRKEHKINNLKEYYDLIFKKENEGICLTCGKETKFINLNKGYLEFCSNGCVSKNDGIKDKKKNKSLITHGKKCVFQSEEVKKKIVETNIKKFGVDNVFKSEEIKNKIKKVKLEKYGNENYRNSKKIEKTNLERYGEKVPLKNKEVKNKLIQTNLERYGGSAYTCSEEYKIFMSKYWKEKNAKKFEELIKKYNWKIEFKDQIKSEYIFHCNECNEDFNINQQLFRVRTYNNFKICTNCNDPEENKKSNTELEIVAFLREKYNDEVIERDRNEIKPYELDIYLPKEKLAIEFNGLFWHNELYKENDFHLNKTKMCEDKGLHLIHIYEDDWKYKKEIVKSRLLNLLGKSEKIFARKCNLKEISFKESKDFLIENHLQSYCISKINLGLFYNDELVSVMTFGNLRKNLGNVREEGKYELLRFCNKLNYTVIGGANRLFKYFLDNYHPKEVISYADRSWTMKDNNSLYDKIGFKFEKETKPNYYYEIDSIRENRFKYRKDVLISEGFDKNKSEHEIMLERKIYRIYDSGQLKFVYK